MLSDRQRLQPWCHFAAVCTSLNLLTKNNFLLDDLMQCCEGKLLNNLAEEPCKVRRANRVHQKWHCIGKKTNKTANLLKIQSRKLPISLWTSTSSRVSSLRLSNHYSCDKSSENCRIKTTRERTWQRGGFRNEIFPFTMTLMYFEMYRHPS